MGIPAQEFNSSDVELFLRLARLRPDLGIGILLLGPGGDNEVLLTKDNLWIGRVSPGVWNVASLLKGGERGMLLMKDLGVAAGTFMDAEITRYGAEQIDDESFVSTALPGGQALLKPAAADPEAREWVNGLSGSSAVPDILLAGLNDLEMRILKESVEWEERAPESLRDWVQGNLVRQIETGQGGFGLLHLSRNGELSVSAETGTVWKILAAKTGIPAGELRGPLEEALSQAKAKTGSGNPADRLQFMASTIGNVRNILAARTWPIRYAQSEPVAGEKLDAGLYSWIGWDPEFKPQAGAAVFTVDAVSKQVFLETSSGKKQSLDEILKRPVLAAFLNPKTDLQKEKARLYLRYLNTIYRQSRGEYAVLAVVESGADAENFIAETKIDVLFPVIFSANSRENVFQISDPAAFLTAIIYGRSEKGIPRKILVSGEKPVPGGSDKLLMSALLHGLGEISAADAGRQQQWIDSIMGAGRESSQGRAEVRNPDWPSEEDIRSALVRNDIDAFKGYFESYTKEKLTHLLQTVEALLTQSVELKRKGESIGWDQLGKELRSDFEPSEDDPFTEDDLDFFLLASDPELPSTQTWDELSHYLIADLMRDIGASLPNDTDISSLHAAVVHLLIELMGREEVTDRIADNPRAQNALLDAMFVAMATRAVSGIPYERELEKQRLSLGVWINKMLNPAHDFNFDVFSSLAESNFDADLFQATLRDEGAISRIHTFLWDHKHLGDIKTRVRSFGELNQMASLFNADLDEEEIDRYRRALEGDDVRGRLLAAEFFAGYSKPGVTDTGVLIGQLKHIVKDDNENPDVRSAAWDALRSNAHVVPKDFFDSVFAEASKNRIPFQVIEPVTDSAELNQEIIDALIREFNLGTAISENSGNNRLLKDTAEVLGALIEEDEHDASDEINTLLHPAALAQALIAQSGQPALSHEKIVEKLQAVYREIKNTRSEVRNPPLEASAGQVYPLVVKAVLGTLDGIELPEIARDVRAEVRLKGYTVWADGVRRAAQELILETNPQTRSESRLVTAQQINAERVLDLLAAAVKAVALDQVTKEGAPAVGFHAPGSNGDILKDALGRTAGGTNMIALISRDTPYLPEGAMRIGDLARQRALASYGSGRMARNSDFIPVVAIGEPVAHAAENGDLILVESTGAAEEVFGAFAPVVDAASRTFFAALTGLQADGLNEIKTQRAEVRRKIIQALITQSSALREVPADVLEGLLDFSGNRLIVNQQILGRLAAEFLSRSEVRKSA